MSRHVLCYLVLLLCLPAACARRTGQNALGSLSPAGSTQPVVAPWLQLVASHELHRTHDHVAHSVAFSPDGRFVYSVGGWHSSGRSQGELVILDVQSNVAKYVNVRAECREVAVSHDGRVVAASAYGSGLALFDAATGEQTRVLTREHTIYQILGFTADDRGLVLLAGRRIRIWDFAAGVAPEPLGSGAEDVAEAAMNHDASLLSTASDAGVLRLWRMSDWQQVCSFRTQTGRAASYGLAVADNGSVAYVMPDDLEKPPQIIDLQHDRAQLLPPFGSLRRRGAISPDGRLVASDRALFETAGARLVDPPDWLPPGECNERLVFSPDGKYLAATTSERQVKVWRIIDDCRPRPQRPPWKGVLEPLARFESTEELPVEAVAFDPKGGTVYALSGKSLRIVDLRSRQVSTVALPSAFKSMSLDPEGKKLALGAGQLQRLDAALGESKDRPPGLALLAVPSGRAVQWLDRDGGHEVVGFAPDGASLLTLTGVGELQQWGLATTKPAVRIRDVEEAALSGNRKVLLTYDHDGIVRLWRTLDWTVTSTFKTDRTFAGVPTVSYDGTAALLEPFVLLFGDRTPVLVHFGSATRQTPLKSRRRLDRDMYSSGAFSPDGRLVVSHCAYDATTGQQLWQLRVEPSATASVFSGDGALLVTGGWKGEVVIWRVNRQSDRGPTTGRED